MITDPIDPKDNVCPQHPLLCRRIRHIRCFSIFFSHWWESEKDDLRSDHLTKWNSTRNATMYFDRFLEGFVLWPLHQTFSASKGPSSGCDASTTRCQMFCRPRNDGVFHFGCCQSHHAFSGPKYLAGARKRLEQWEAEFCYTLENPFLHHIFLWFWCRLESRPRDLWCWFFLVSLVLRSNWGSGSVARWACCRGRVFIRPNMTQLRQETP